MFKRIITIVGKSGTGKTTLVRELQKQYDIPTIVSYTTRPPRYKGEDTHIFVSEKEFDDLRQSKNFIAHTTYGGYRYAGEYPDADVAIYVLDQRALQELDQHPDFILFNILLTCPEDIRTNRVGTERVQRDIGQAHKPDDFCLCIDTSGDKDETQQAILASRLKKFIQGCDYRKEYRFKGRKEDSDVTPYGVTIMAENQSEAIKRMHKLKYEIFDNKGNKILKEQS